MIIPRWSDRHSGAETDNSEKHRCRKYNKREEKKSNLAGPKTTQQYLQISLETNHPVEKKQKSSLDTYMQCLFDQP